MFRSRMMPSRAWLYALATAAASAPSMRDHTGADVETRPELSALVGGCTRAVERQLSWQASGAGLPIWPGDEPVPPVAPPTDGRISIAYLVMAHREYAHATISRLIRVLWAPEHLFLLHFDARTNASSVRFVRERFDGQDNVHVMESRRVGWGAFSMVEVLIKALKTALASAPAFDFFINLSDADVALRTPAELDAFLRGFRGRSFVALKFPEVDAMRYNAHTHMRSFVWLECDGAGFIVLNTTADGFFGQEGKRCCYARSGPIVYSNLSIGRPPPPAEWEFFHGSQWAILARNAAEWLVTDADAAGFARHLQLTYMADETYVQTALMNSPLRETLINHNLRYIDWPHGYGDPNAYWHSVGAKHIAGPMVLTAELFDRVVASGAVFGRKVDLETEAGVGFFRRWDEWMTAKLEREGESGASRGAAEAAGSSQPAIASGLLSESPTLDALRPPPTASERRALTADQLKSRHPRAVHFGHEDVMSQQFTRQHKVPSRATSAGVPPQGGAARGGADADAGSELRGGAAGGGSGGADAPVRLAGITFADGSSCTCEAHCGLDGKSECCDDFPAACAGAGEHGLDAPTP